MIPRKHWLLAATLFLPLAVPAAARAQQVRAGGVVYAEYEYLLSDSAQHRNDFNVTRAYVNLLGSFDHHISTRVTGDVFRNAEGSLGYRLKYAFAQWSPEGSVVAPKFGLIQTPWLDWEETLWGYRMQGPMALDRAGYLTSADFGAGADVNWREQLLNGSIVVVNGEGYQNPPGGRTVDVEARLSLRLLPSDDASRVGGLRLSGYAGTGRFENGQPRDRWIGMLSYRSKLLTLAGEYAATRSGAFVASTPDAPAIAVTTHGRVISGFGVLRVPGSPVDVIARLDHVDPDTRLDEDALNRWIGGVSYRLGSNVRLLADLERVDYEGAAPTAALAAARTRALFQTEFAF